MNFFVIDSLILTHFTVNFTDHVTSILKRASLISEGGGDNCKVAEVPAKESLHCLETLYIESGMH